MNMKNIQFDFGLQVATAAVGMGWPDLVPNALKRQEPPMELRDEIIMLLHVAAEIEHSLLVQYLYTAFSIPDEGLCSDWRNDILQISKEEMGHLLSMQNLLLALSGPLHFEREEFPYNALYPFPFELRGASLQTLATYVLAEMPDYALVPVELRPGVDQARKLLGGALPVNRVGAVFKLLSELIAGLKPEDIDVSSLGYQATPASWRTSSNMLVLEQVGSVEQALALVAKIGAQGEGPDDQASLPSHFKRFLRIFNEASAWLVEDSARQLSNPVPINPTVKRKEADGYLSHPAARAFGDISNHRYRNLMNAIQLSMLVEAGTDRTLFQQWAFQEMQLMSRLAEELGQLPAKEGAADTIAAPPFELPFSLDLNARHEGIWRTVKMLALAGLDQLDRYALTGSVASRLRMIDSARLQRAEQALTPSSP